MSDVSLWIDTLREYKQEKIIEITKNQKHRRFLKHILLLLLFLKIKIKIHIYL